MQIDGWKTKHPHKEFLKPLPMCPETRGIRSLSDASVPYYTRSPKVGQSQKQLSAATRW